MEKFSVELGESKKGHFRQGSNKQVQWNRAFLLVKSFKLVSRPLDEGPRPRQIKLWFCLHGIILKGKPIGLDQSKSLKGELMGKLGFKVVHCFCFFFLFFTIFFYLVVQNLWESKTCYGLRTLMRAHQFSQFWPILKLTWLVLCILTSESYKKHIFTFPKCTKWRWIIIFQCCPIATGYNAITCTITQCTAIVKNKIHQYFVPMLSHCV
jgi:hypothetical protein